LFFVKKNKKIAIWDETTNQLTTSFYDDFMGIQYTESALGEPKIAEQAYYMLYFVKKEGKCGAVDENGITRIPFIYDGFGSISSFYFITRIKKKFGVNMISSIYPPIKPQYESFEHVINLPVSDTWQFCIFSATLNGKPGYVGENGKRYFIN
jgi:hypothetical protein